MFFLRFLDILRICIPCHVDGPMWASAPTEVVRSSTIIVGADALIRPPPKGFSLISHPFAICGEYKSAPIWYHKGEKRKAVFL